MNEKIMCFSGFYQYYFVVITLVVNMMCCISSGGDIRRTLCVSAFQSIESGGSIGRRKYRYELFPSRLKAATNNNDDSNDWVSRLEEQFKKSENINNNKKQKRKKKKKIEYSRSIQRRGTQILAPGGYGVCWQTRGARWQRCRVSELCRLE